MNNNAELTCYKYGTSGPPVMVLHGGPAAVGTARPLAHALSKYFRVFEPWQRNTHQGVVSVTNHVEDLRYLIQQQCRGVIPAIVGESWGAMLALAFAVSYPQLVGHMALVGCGTFTTQSRERFQQNLANRLSKCDQEALASLESEPMDEAERFLKKYEIVTPYYTYAPVCEPVMRDASEFDAEAHKQTWQDMLRLQRKGVYPQRFSEIQAPVIMIHGTYDPHPPEMIYRTLYSYMPHLERRFWEQCGHDPMNEKYVREPFFEHLSEWLGQA